MRALLASTNCQESIIQLLVTILRYVFESATEEARPKESKPVKMLQWNGLGEDDMREKERLLSGYIQQAYATKLIR